MWCGETKENSYLEFLNRQTFLKNLLTSLHDQVDMGPAISTTEFYQKRL